MSTLLHCLHTGQPLPAADAQAIAKARRDAAHFAHPSALVADLPNTEVADLLACLGDHCVAPRRAIALLNLLADHGLLQPSDLELVLQREQQVMDDYDDYVDALNNPWR